MFEFTDDYKTGISEIDKEHESLFNILNEALSAINENETNIQNLAADLLNKLKSYAAMHFSHEEAYMEKINDPELPRQKTEHTAFTKKMDEFVIDASTKAKDVEELLKYVVRWLFAHILASDMMIGKCITATKKDPFAFTEEYFTNIGFIDEEHEKLFDIIRQANDLISIDYLHDKYDEIIRILDSLRDYTERHFQHEEKYMEEIHYPKLEAQKRAHSAFIQKLVNINYQELDEMDDNQQQYLEDLVDYLLNWLSTHILKADCLIPKWLKEQQSEAK